MSLILRRWLIWSNKSEIQRLQRLDVIQGTRLDMTTPAVRVFSARTKVAQPG